MKLKVNQINNLIDQLKDRDVDLASANLDDFLDQDTKKVDRPAKMLARI